MKRMVFIFMLFILALTACQDIPATQTESPQVQGSVERVELRNTRIMYFPRQPADGDQMEALLEGQLVLRDSCLRVTASGYEQPGFLILWPPGAGLRPAESGVVEVLDSSGNIVGRVGETLRIGGGAMEDESTMALWETQIDGMPITGCPGPYWVAGELYPLAEPVEKEAPQPLATPEAQQPAAGICAEAEGTLVSVTLRPDVPDPRCVRVRPDQQLNVKNETDQTLRISLAYFQANLAPGEEFTIEASFGEYLAPGIHRLMTSAPPGGPEIWLVGE